MNNSWRLGFITCTIKGLHLPTFIRYDITESSQSFSRKIQDNEEVNSTNGKVHTYFHDVQSHRCTFTFKLQYKRVIPLSINNQYIGKK
jgi:hypothetical protein